MKNYIQDGDNLTIVAGSTIAGGDVVIAGDLIGVALGDAASGADVTIRTTGVFELPKTSAQAWTLGVKVYWTGTEATTTATSNTLIGAAVEVAANPSATGKVKI